jgi:hypothetical protein
MCWLFKDYKYYFVLSKYELLQAKYEIRYCIKFPEYLSIPENWNGMYGISMRYSAFLGIQYSAKNDADSSLSTLKLVCACSYSSV